MSAAPSDSTAGAPPASAPPPGAFARVRDEVVAEAPGDLYIPPDAMRVLLDAFEGPLDFLLYLIRRKNLDVLEVSVSAVTDQYIAYIAAMSAMQVELAAEYLAMAATLAEIKSRLLLPPAPGEGEEEEEDPRSEIVRRLLEYQRFRKAAEDLDMLPRMERDWRAVEVESAARRAFKPPPTVDLAELCDAMRALARRVELRRSYQVARASYSVKERMALMLARLAAGGLVPFADCFTSREGRAGAIVSLLALLELMRTGAVEAEQAAPYAPLYLRGGG